MKLQFAYSTKSNKIKRIKIIYFNDYYSVQLVMYHETVTDKFFCFVQYNCFCAVPTMYAFKFNEC